MNFKIATLEKTLAFLELCELLGDPYDSMVKFAVDVEQETIVFGGEMHADAEQVLLEQESNQKDIWGANLYPERNRSDWLEYTSLINIRPTQDNFSMEISSDEIKNKINSIVNKVVK